MSGSQPQARQTEDDLTGEHSTLSLPVLELNETDDGTDSDVDRSRGFDPYNSGSFVLKK